MRCSSSALQKKPAAAISHESQLAEKKATIDALQLKVAALEAQRATWRWVFSRVIYAFFAVVVLNAMVPRAVLTVLVPPVVLDTLPGTISGLGIPLPTQGWLLKHFLSGHEVIPHVTPYPHLPIDPRLL